MTSAAVVDIVTGARLHFGLLCGTPETRWIFGGIGLMVREPGWQIRLHCRAASAACRGEGSGTGGISADEVITADPETRGRILETLARCRSLLQLPPHPVFAVQVRRASPWHAGFGAGTQLVLAVASGVELLSRQARAGDVLHLAQQLGRAGRSAVGSEGFAHGGFIVDYGLPAGEPSRRQLLRVSVPDEWRFLLIRPRRESGISGESERQYFERRQTMSADLIAALAGIIEQRLLPAMRCGDLPGFAQGLEDYGRETGQFYANAQGAVFSSPLMHELAQWLRTQGIPGAAQSSWGPGICVPAASQAAAAQIARLITTRLDPQQVELLVTSALNHGATIRTEAPEQDESCRVC